MRSTEMSPLKEKPVRKNLDELIFESADNGVDTVDSDNQIDDDIFPPEAEIYSDDTIDEDPEELIPAEEFNGLPTDVQQNFKKKANEYIRHSPSAKDVPSAIGILGEDGTVYHISTDITSSSSKTSASKSGINVTSPSLSLRNKSICDSCGICFFCIFERSLFTLSLRCFAEGSSLFLLIG
uniref:Uncharacterized protein n=1 Tax=Phlebotomus papatasi TaxID=29031 RepID=A0A1B0CZS7_PHLPP